MNQRSLIQKPGGKSPQPPASGGFASRPFARSLSVQGAAPIQLMKDEKGKTKQEKEEENKEEEATGDESFRQQRRIMREALQIEPARRDDAKIPFPFSFYDEAFPVERQRHTVTIGGGREETRDLEVRQPAPIPGILRQLPSSMTKGGHFGRLLRLPDPAHGESAPPQTAVTLDQLREAMAGFHYARSRGLDVSRITRPSANVDFAAPNEAGEMEGFDPFTSPQKEELSRDERVREILRREGASGVKASNFDPVRARKTALGKFTGTYKKHTEGKGAGVVGIWDQTSDTPEEVEELRKTAHRLKPAHELDLKLDEEYVREDMAARAEDMGHWKYNQVIRASHRKRRREAEEREESRLKRARPGSGTGSFEPTGVPAPAWGGPGPNAVEPYGWGQNHPLYMRHFRDPGAF
jgi:hypothetical protein